MSHKYLIAIIVVLTCSLYMALITPFQTAVAVVQSHTITGVVRDFDGTPVANVLVSTDFQDPTTDTALTDDKGVYTLTVTAGVYHIRVRKFNNELDPPAQEVTVPPDQDNVDFTFPQRLTIQGTVREHDGTPVVDVRVATDRDDPLFASARTDANGAYTLTVIAGTYHLEIRKYFDTLDPPAQEVTVPPAQSNVDFTFPQRLTIQGTVREHDGTPVADVRVSTGSDDPVSASALTDANGIYTLTVIAGTYHLAIREHYNVLDPPAQEVTVPPAQSNVDFTFPQRLTIKGTVRKHDGTPVNEARVATSFDDPVSTTTQTDVNGLYTLTVRSGTYHISIYKTGLPRPPEYLLDVQTNLSGVDLTFLQPYIVSGIVRDDAGTPIVGASINGGLRASFSGANGTYTTTIAPGEKRIYADKDGYQASYDLLVNAPPHLTGVDLQLWIRDRIIRGRTTNSQGQPIADARVWAANLLDGDLGTDSTRSDATGHYTLTIPAGVYWIRADHDDYVQAPPAQVDVSNQDAQLNLVLDSATNTIRGLVQDSTGTRIADARVSASTCRLGFSTKTDVSGAYTLTVIANTYEVYARKSDYGASEDLFVSVPPNATDVNLILPSLPPTYQIHGQVTNVQGEPIADIQVYASGPNDSDSDWTDANGIYTLTVTAGTYTVQPTNKFYTTPTTQTVAVPPAQRDVNFVMSPIAWNQSIQGKVIDESGDPIPVARISIDEKNRSTIDEFKQVYYDGTYSTTLPAGSYEIYAWGRLYRTSETRDIELPPDQANVDFTLSARDQLITGRLLDSNGNPLCGVRVRAAGDVSDSATSERNGRYTLQVAPGTYTISATANGYAVPVTQTITVPPFAFGTDVIFDIPNNTITGLVKDAQDTPMTGVRLIATGSTGNVETTSATDGSYRLQVADGNWTVTASKPGYRSIPPSHMVTLPAELGNIDFTLMVVTESTSLYLPLLTR